MLRSTGLRFANLQISSDFSNLLFQITLLVNAKVAIKTEKCHVVDKIRPNSFLLLESFNVPVLQSLLKFITAIFHNTKELIIGNNEKGTYVNSLKLNNLDNIRLILDYNLQQYE